MMKLYVEIEQGGEVLPSHLYQYNRNYQLISNLEQELYRLGAKEKSLLDKNLTRVYKENQKIISDIQGIQTDINEQEVRDAVYQPWVDDGLSFSDRIWNNKRALLNSLEQGMTDVIAAGKSHSQLTRDLMQKFNVSYHSAETLVRTEVAHVQIQSTLNEYKKLGVDKYRFLTAEDERMCEECGALNNNVYYIDEAEYGVNCPPIHPNCRCTVLAVIK